MKKSTLFITLTAWLALVGCGPNGHNNPGGGAPGDNGETPAPAATVDSEQVKSKLQFDKQFMIAAVPFEGPILYQRGEDKVGPEAELGQMIHARIQEELGDEVRLVWVNKSAYGSLINSVARADQHIGMGVLGITELRQRSVDFSESYYTSKLVIAYNPAYKMVNANNLKGLKIGVRAGTAAAAFVTTQYASDSTVEPDATSDDLVLALRRGELDAIIDDRLLLSFSLATVAGTKGLELDETVLAEIPVAIAVPKGSDWVKDIVNEVIATAQTDGQMAAWHEEHVTDAMEAVDRRDEQREATARAARKDRQVVVRVSKEDALAFDIFRLANLPFTFRNTDSGETHRSSRLNFQGRTGVASVSLPPGSYRFSLEKWEAVGGSLEITPRDANRVTVTVRLKADNTVRVTRN